MDATCVRLRRYVEKAVEMMFKAAPPDTAERGYFDGEGFKMGLSGVLGVNCCGCRFS